MNPFEDQFRELRDAITYNGETSRVVYYYLVNLRNAVRKWLGQNPKLLGETDALFDLFLETLDYSKDRSKEMDRYLQILRQTLDSVRMQQRYSE